MPKPASKERKICGVAPVPNTPRISQNTPLYTINSL
jgi:hypothetical protein